MRKFLSIPFMMVCILTTFKSFCQVDTQVDTVAITNFVIKQTPSEEKFIALLKGNQIDSCMKFFSEAVINKYGTDSLQNELKNLNKLFLKYPSPVNEPSISISHNGVGGFGHDNEASYERKSLYQFMGKKEKVVYYFSLYFNNEEPIGIIKFYDSKDLTDFKPIKSNMKLIK